MRLHGIEQSGTLSALLRHPSLGGLLSTIRLVIAPLDVCLHPLGLTAGAGRGELLISHALANQAAALVLLRFGLEFAAISAASGLGAAPASLLAARAAGAFLRLLPLSERRLALECPAAQAMHRLSGALPSEAELLAVWLELNERIPFSGAMAPVAEEFLMVRKLWGLALPLEALLIDGGDDRLMLDPSTGQNRYGCSPWPRPDTIGFSSCTASSVSISAFVSTEQTRQSWLSEASQRPTHSVLRVAAQQVQADILAYFQAEDLAEVIVAASGTDASLILTGLIAAERPGTAIHSVMVDPAETGSGVPHAVQGRHFASCTAAGCAVEKGQVIAGFQPEFGLSTLGLRSAAGVPRPAEAVELDCAAAVALAASKGHAVLHAIDGSKTGLVAPDFAACQKLAAVYGSRLDIVIDACQARVEPAMVRAYLLQGWPVLVTGSKFFGAPGFCGAILFPRDRLRRVEAAWPLPNGLGAYSPIVDGLPSSRCAGILLRWIAALQEMRRFAELSSDEVSLRIDGLCQSALQGLARNTELQIVASPRPRRSGWSNRGSVITFTVGHGDQRLSPAQLRPIYRALNTGVHPCLIGQPVQLGSEAVGGLRVAFSASQVIGGVDLAPALAMVFERLQLERDRLRLGHTAQ